MNHADFTFEEHNLLCIYPAESRQEMIDGLTQLQACLEEDEQELMELTKGTLTKLRAMTDEAFEQLELVPDF